MIVCMPAYHHAACLSRNVSNHHARNVHVFGRPACARTRPGERPAGAPALAEAESARSTGRALPCPDAGDEHAPSVGNRMNIHAPVVGSRTAAVSQSQQ